eukprot:541044_1
MAIDWECTNAYPSFTILSLCCYMVIALMLLCLGVHGLIGFRKSETILNIFKYLFVLTIVSSLLFIMSEIVRYTLCVNGLILYGTSLKLVSFGSYTLLTSTLLATLIGRLYFTFQKSIYSVSNAKLICMITTYIFTAILVICAAFSHDIIFFCTATLYGITYIGLSIYATSLFAQALFKLTTVRAISISNMTKQNSVKLNEQQTETIAKTSRYISVISLAMFTTISTAFCIALADILISFMTVGHIEVLIVKMLLQTVLSCDCLVNVACVYMQYPFGRKYYDKHCKCLENWWNSKLVSCAEKSLNRRHKTDIETQESDLNAVAKIQDYTEEEVNLEQNNCNIEQKLANALRLNNINSTRL